MTRSEDFYMGPPPLSERIRSSGRRGIAAARQALKIQPVAESPTPRESPFRDAGRGDEQQDALNDTPDAKEQP